MTVIIENITKEVQNIVLVRDILLGRDIVLLENTISLVEHTRIAIS